MVNSEFRAKLPAGVCLTQETSSAVTVPPLSESAPATVLQPEPEGHGQAAHAAVPFSSDSLADNLKRD